MLSLSLWHFRSWGGWEAVRLQVWGQTPHWWSWVGIVHGLCVCVCLCLCVWVCVCVCVHARASELQSAINGVWHAVRGRWNAHHTNPHICEYSQLHDKVEVWFALEYFLQRHDVGVLQPARGERRGRRGVVHFILLLMFYHILTCHFHYTK